MAKRWRLETAKTAATASGRRVLADVVAATAQPTLSSQGYSTQGCELLHIEFVPTGGVFQVQLWWWSNTSASWHQGEVLNVNAADIVTVEVNALPRIYVQVSVAPGVFNLSAWIDLVVQEA